MELDEANSHYIPTSADTLTVRALVDQIIGATLPVFNHCRAYTVVWDPGYDTLADTYIPRDGFRIPMGGSRLAALRRLLDYTANVARFRHPGQVHIMRPVTTGPAFDYTYNLQHGHTFFSKAHRNTLVFPNRVVVRSQRDDTPQFEGSAQVPDFAALPTDVQKTKFLQARLESATQASAIAAAMIAKAEMGSARGQAEVPLNVGAEVFDYVQVIDQRQGDTRTGNLGYVHRHFGQNKWTMTFGFGNWFDAIGHQAALKGLETYTDTGQGFNRLIFLDQVVEGIFGRIRRTSLDATGLVLLDQVVEGTFGRIRKNALDATGLVLLDQTVDGTFAKTLATQVSAGRIHLSAETSFGAGYNPITKEEGVHRGASPPVNTALLWWDTTRNMMLRHDGIDWREHTGLWYNKTGVAIDAGRGVGLYGGQVAFETFPTWADYVHRTNRQCFVGTDGRLYAGGGNVMLHAGGLNIDGEVLRFRSPNLTRVGFIWLQDTGFLRIPQVEVSNVSPSGDIGDSLGRPTFRWGFLHLIGALMTANVAAGAEVQASNRAWGALPFGWGKSSDTVGDVWNVQDFQVRCNSAGELFWRNAAGGARPIRWVRTA
jgi:hypothetical protein